MRRERQAKQITKRPMLNVAGEQTAITTPAAPRKTRQSPLISKNKDGQLTISEVGFGKIARTFLGSNASSFPNLESSAGLESALLGQVSGAVPYAEGKPQAVAALNFALDAVAALEPRDGLEVMLCSQLVALHSQSMELMRRGMLPEQSSDGVDSSVNRATRLLRTFATLAECLRTYRGGGQQKVTVEHVTVQAGGQAIVGTVNRGGGGDAQQNRE